MRKILTLALSIAFIGVFGQAKISDLPATTTLTGVELFPVVQGGVTKKTTAAQISSLAASSATNYVPYSGATGSVNLGVNNFSVGAETSLNTLYVQSTTTINGNLLANNNGTFVSSLQSPFLYGSAASGGTLSLFSTSNATKGKIKFGTSSYDEVNNRLGIGTLIPAFDLDITKSAAVVNFNIQNTLSTGYSYIETLGDDGINYISLNSFNTAGGLGGLLANNTSWVIGDAANIGFINQKSTGNLIFATGGVAAGNEKARFTTNHFLVNTTTAPGGLLSQMRVAKGTGLIDFGEYTSGRGAIWFNQSTPTNTNWSFSADGSNNTFLNGATSARVLVNGNIIFSVFSNLTTWTDAINLSFGTTTGSKIGTATSQKISFWNATPIVQPVNTVAIDDVLIKTGLRASGGAANFTLKIKNNLPQNLKGYTVATLPAGTLGDLAYVTDALAPTYLGIIVGGGAIKTPVFYDGTNWIAH